MSIVAAHYLFLGLSNTRWTASTRTTLTAKVRQKLLRLYRSVTRRTQSLAVISSRFLLQNVGEAHSVQGLSCILVRRHKKKKKNKREKIHRCKIRVRVKRPPKDKTKNVYRFQYILKPLRKKNISDFEVLKRFFFIANHIILAFIPNPKNSLDPESDQASHRTLSVLERPFLFIIAGS